MTCENRSEFVRLYCEWLLTESVERQFEPFRKGFAASKTARSRPSGLTKTVKKRAVFRRTKA